MGRREFLAGAVSLSIAAAAEAQRGSKAQTLAVFSPFQPSADMQESSRNRYYHTIFAELRRLGHVDGRNLTVERFGKEQNTAGFDALAAEVVRSNPDVILSIGFTVAELQAATTSIPIVAFTGDPIALGLTKSLAHPGGNITGVSVNAGPEIWGKRVEFLHEAFPAIAKPAFLGPHNINLNGSVSAAVRSACESLRLPLMTALYDLPVGEPGCPKAIADAVREGADCVIVSDTPDTFENRVLLTALVSEARLPAIYGESEFVEAGGLMAYEGDFIELCQRTAEEIDAILRGANPGDVPFFQPTKFDLTINLKTAEALGLTVPPLLLARADNVIE
jgi:putative ABC transport system substrate-binding protein